MSYGTEDHKHSAYDVFGVADEHHRHYDLESEVRGLREDLSRAEARIRDLEDSHGEVREELRDALERIRAQEDRQPDYAGPEEPEPEEYDPGPEADDEGGMSQYRGYAAAPDTRGER